MKSKVYFDIDVAEIRARHDAFKPWKIMFMRDYRIHLKPAHKDRGELLDALKEIGELVECWEDKPIVEHAARREENIIQAAFDHCAGGIKAILDKL